MKNPCVRECPDRTPGCNCEKRKAWKFQQAQIAAAKRRDDLALSFISESIRRTKHSIAQHSKK